MPLRITPQYNNKRSETCSTICDYNSTANYSFEVSKHNIFKDAKVDNNLKTSIIIDVRDFIMNDKIFIAVIRDNDDKKPLRVHNFYYSSKEGEKAIQELAVPAKSKDRGCTATAFFCGDSYSDDDVSKYITLFECKLKSNDDMEPKLEHVEVAHVKIYK